MMKAQICVELGWTEQEFLSQRWDFVSSIIEEFNERARAIKRAERNANFNG